MVLYEPYVPLATAVVVAVSVIGPLTELLLLLLPELPFVEPLSVTVPDFEVVETVDSVPLVQLALLLLLHTAPLTTVVWVEFETPTFAAEATSGKVERATVAAVKSQPLIRCFTRS